MLKKLLTDLIKNDKANTNYIVPPLWNYHNYQDYLKSDTGEIIVNPYLFYANAIKYIIDNKCELNRNPNWIKKASIYSMMIRLSTSWNHGNDYQNIGTFVKSIALLPYLSYMGIDTIYLLPVFKYSKENKKGTLGSPYAISNFYKLEESLKDDLSSLSVDDEFKAFVEAAHLLNIKIIIDIIPRTIAIDNDLICEHPEWFYWIKESDLNLYKAPKVKAIKKADAPIYKNMIISYKDNEVKKHIKKFMQNPKDTNPILWDKIKKNAQSIKDNFGLVIAPAFSDWINDNQPPWTDITFFRLYLDNPNEAQLDFKANPYILHDTIKCNIYPGIIPNKELWERLANIIPHYQKDFDIDGARIDMGHALPRELNDTIINNAKIINPNFAFIAEELDPGKANEVKAKGYDIFLGNGFFQEPRYNGPLQWFMNNAFNFQLPVLALGESHDTPRLAARKGGKTLSKMLTILNMFIPNSANFINSGQEFFEENPINTGLDFDGITKYSNLALFDYYEMKYLNCSMVSMISAAHKIRNKYIDCITDLDNYIAITIKKNKAIVFCYKIKSQILLIVGNTSPIKSVDIIINSKNIKEHTKKRKGHLLFSINENYPCVYDDFNKNNNPCFNLLPGEVKIVAM